MQEDFLFYAAALALISLAFWFWNNLSDEIQQEQYRYKLFQASLIEVNGSNELQNYLDNLSVDERLKFKRDYIKESIYPHLPIIMKHKELIDFKKKSSKSL